MVITIKYGLEQITKNYENAPTIGALKGDSNIRAVLGYGDNTKALINGVEMSNDVQVPAGAVVTFETACNSKAL